MSCLTWTLASHMPWTTKRYLASTCGHPPFRSSGRPGCIQKLASGTVLHNGGTPCGTSIVAPSTPCFGLVPARLIPSLTKGSSSRFPFSIPPSLRPWEVARSGLERVPHFFRGFFLESLDMGLRCFSGRTPMVIRRGGFQPANLLANPSFFFTEDYSGKDASGWCWCWCDVVEVEAPIGCCPAKSGEGYR